MDDLYEVFLNHIKKNERSITAICKPLQDCLDIPLFCYGRVETNGTVVNLSNSLYELDVYYDNKMYLHDPHLVHPHLLRSGTIFIPSSYNPEYMQTICKITKFTQILAIVETFEDHTEIFSFGTKGNNSSHSKLFNSLDLLHRFIRHFKREAEPLIEKARRDKFNGKNAKGKIFFEGQPTPLLINDPQTKRFLNLVMPLTKRERQCLELFKQGKTAQMTGAILGLSQRTVESYFENIKNKLGCSNKSDLLLW